MGHRYYSSSRRQLGCSLRHPEYELGVSHNLTCMLLCLATEMAGAYVGAYAGAAAVQGGAVGVPVAAGPAAVPYSQPTAGVASQPVYYSQQPRTTTVVS